MFFCDDSTEKAEAEKFNENVVANESDLDVQTKDGEEDTPCVQAILEEEKKKKVIKKWKTLKRINQLHNEKILKNQSECLRTKVLEYMRKKIIGLEKEERNAWILKLIRLAFLRNLKQIKKSKQAKQFMFVKKLQSAKGIERDKLLEKIAELKEAHEYKELLDVNAVLNYKRLKKLQKFEKAKKLDLMIKLKRLKKSETVKKRHEKDLKKIKIERITEIIKLRKDWQEEVAKKIEECVNSLAKEVVMLDDKVKWYDDLLERLENEKAALLEEEKLAHEMKKAELKGKLNREELLKEREEKKTLLENCKKEKIRRLWKSQRLKDFLKFLDNRQAIAQMDENRFFKKIYTKLTQSEKKVVEVDPWKQSPPKDEGKIKMDEDKRLKAWVQSIIASNKNKFLHKIKLKKYLELMDVPQLDSFMSSTKRFEGVQNVMCIVRGRIFRNTFPENIKNFIAKTYTDISIKAMRDIRDIDPENVLVNIQISTAKHAYVIGTGKEFSLIVQQRYFEPDIPCQEKEGVLCLTKDDKEKIVKMALERSEGRKVIADRRMAEYAAYLDRKPADDMWFDFLKSALTEDVPCWLRGKVKHPDHHLTPFYSSVLVQQQEDRESKAAEAKKEATQKKDQRSSRDVPAPYYSIQQPKHSNVIQRAKLRRQEEARRKPPEASQFE